MTHKTHINVTWSLPVIGPFVVLAAMRVLWWFAGAQWSEPEGCALLALIFGGMGGVVAIATGGNLTIRKWWIK